ncbi:TraC family protein [Candidatus Saccharibacteria bacterium]|nr:TraC family protein [Candidatus Saccharibacteria bacterium]
MGPRQPQITPAPAAASNPNSTQNTLQIAEVRDGIAIMNDGTFRAVIMCKAINFDLMSPQEREAVEFAYQGFLNSLNFPIQIFMRSEKVDLKPYLQKLDKIRAGQDNMLLALLMEDYISFLDAIAQQANIMDKQFYVVISYPDPNQDVRSTIKQSTGFFTGMADLFGSKDKTPRVVIDEKVLEDAKTELRNRVQAVIEGLQQASVQSLPLDTQELIELYYNVYNPDTATHQHLGKFEDISATVIGKGESAAQPQGAQT